MNPYQPVRLEDAKQRTMYRTSRTFVEAVFTGWGMSFLAPICNAIYCDLVLNMPFSTTIWGMLRTLIPLAFLCVILATACSAFIPDLLSRALSRHQTAIPIVTISLLYSIYFSMLGFGLVNGGVFIFGYYLTYYALSPALISGFGVLIYIAVRPRRSIMHLTTIGEPTVATETASQAF